MILFICNVNDLFKQINFKLMQFQDHESFYVIAPKRSDTLSPWQHRKPKHRLNFLRRWQTSDDYTNIFPLDQMMEVVTGEAEADTTAHISLITGLFLDVITGGKLRCTHLAETRDVGYGRWK